MTRYVFVGAELEHVSVKKETLKRSNRNHLLTAKNEFTDRDDLVAVLKEHATRIEFESGQSPANSSMDCNATRTSDSADLCCVAVKVVRESVSVRAVT